MDPTLILYPSIAMALLTLGLLSYMGIARVGAARRGEVDPRYYKTYHGAGQPERLHVLGRHVQNHFEVPPLFHAAVLATYVTGLVDPVAVSLAWTFVASRVVHSVVHLGRNRVPRRLAIFAVGVLALVVLWARLLAGLLG